MFYLKIVTILDTSAVKSQLGNENKFHLKSLVKWYVLFLNEHLLVKISQNRIFQGIFTILIYNDLQFTCKSWLDICQ